MKDYLHEIPKETLTIKNIKQDIKEKHKTSIGASLLLVVLGTILLIAAKDMYTYIKIYSIFIGVTGVASIFSGMFILFLPLIGQKITNKKLVIVEDWLVDIGEEVEYYGRSSRRYYKFCFAKGGKYLVYPDDYYNENYKMSNQGLYNYSQINDDFYLVFSNEKKNNLILIYNKKLFELCD